MAKAEFGLKRLCANCGTHFYDFGKTPIVCPKCNTQFVIDDPVQKALNAAPIIEAKPLPKVTTEDDDTLMDDDDSAAVLLESDDETDDLGDDFNDDDTAADDESMIEDASDLGGDDDVVVKDV